MEIRLLGVTALDGDLSVEGCREGIHRPSFHLGPDLVRVDGNPAVDRAHDPMDAWPAVIVYRHLRHVRGIAAVGEADGDTAGSARRQRRPPARLLGGQIQDAPVAW